jgi:hypothetical protein
MFKLFKNICMHCPGVFRTEEYNFLKLFLFSGINICHVFLFLNLFSPCIYTKGQMPGSSTITHGFMCMYVCMGSVWYVCVYMCDCKLWW